MGNSSIITADYSRKASDSTINNVIVKRFIRGAEKTTKQIINSLVTESCNEIALYDDAIEAFKQVARLKPDFSDAYLNLGLTYGAMGRYQEAIEAFKQAISRSPDDANAHFGLGLSYLSTGNRSSALEEYKILKSLDADMAEKLFDRIYK